MMAFPVILLPSVELQEVVRKQCTSSVDASESEAVPYVQVAGPGTPLLEAPFLKSSMVSKSMSSQGRHEGGVVTARAG